MKAYNFTNKPPPPKKKHKKNKKQQQQTNKQKTNYHISPQIIAHEKAHYI
jgi:hypothetical protein